MGKMKSKPGDEPQMLGFRQLKKLRLKDIDRFCTSAACDTDFSEWLSHRGLDPKKFIRGRLKRGLLSRYVYMPQIIICEITIGKDTEARYFMDSRQIGFRPEEIGKLSTRAHENMHKAGHYKGVPGFFPDKSDTYNALNEGLTDLLTEKIFAVKCNNYPRLTEVAKKFAGIVVWDAVFNDYFFAGNTSVTKFNLIAGDSSAFSNFNRTLQLFWQYGSTETDYLSTANKIIDEVAARAKMRTK